jgi:hypothetical protein
MITHNIDEYEWVEKEFDHWYLLHKQRDYAIARVWNFNGWMVQIVEQDPLPMTVDSFDAAKAIAMINATQNFERFPNAYLYPRRTPKPAPEEVRKRVRSVARIRRSGGLG